MANKEVFRKFLHEFAERKKQGNQKLSLHLIEGVVESLLTGDCEIVNFARQGDSVFVEFSWEVAHG